MNTGGHILTSFNEDLSLLKEKTILVGTNSLNNLDNAITGLLSRDIDICSKTVMAKDNDEGIEAEVDKLGLSIITRYRPMATDLRMVIASMKIASNLERISGHALSIAKRTRKMLKHEEPEAIDNIQALYQISRKTIESSLQSYADADTELAQQVLDNEKSISKTYKKTSKLYTKLLEKNDGQERDYLDLVFITRYIEHVASIAVTIAEDVIFTYPTFDTLDSEIE